MLLAISYPTPKRTDQGGQPLDAQPGTGIHHSIPQRLGLQRIRQVLSASTQAMEVQHMLCHQLEQAIQLDLFLMFLLGMGSLPCQCSAGSGGLSLPWARRGL